MLEAERLSAPDEDEDGPTRKLYRSLRKHFFLNLDEANHQANTGSDTIVGVKKKKKHEANQGDSRVSITVVECGNAAGVDGPTKYLLAGEQIPRYLNSQFGSSKWLERHGAPPNSFVVMTPNAYMTNEAWDENAEKLAQGIRKMPVIKEYSNFWVILFLDGYKAHVMTYKAQAIFRNYKMLVVKENSHSSQINQVFDQAPARKAKSEDRRWLPIVRDRPGIVGTVDQWVLMAVVMAGQNGGRGSAWTSGFKRVNLHPDHMLPIDVWLSKISDALVAAGGTEMSNDSPYGLQYLRLIKVPEFYAALPPERQLEMKMLTSNASFDWSTEKTGTLPQWCRDLLYKNKSNIYKYFKFSNSMATAVQNGSAISTDLIPAQAIQRLRESHPISNLPVKKTQKQDNKDNMAKLGLESYDLLGGLTEDSSFEEKTATFKKMCKHRSRFEGNLPSAYLMLRVEPDQERRIFQANARDLSIGSFLDAALDVNLGKGLASRKLNMLGEIEGVASIVNSPDGIRRRFQARQLAETVEAIKLSKQQHSNNKKLNKQVSAATRKTKLATEAPIVKLLTDCQILPWIVKGKPSNNLTIPPLKKFLAQHKIVKFLPKSKKPQSKSNLLAFFTEFCKQQVRCSGSSILTIARSVKLSLDRSKPNCVREEDDVDGGDSAAEDTEIEGEDQQEEENKEQEEEEEEEQKRGSPTEDKEQDEEEEEDGGSSTRKRQAVGNLLSSRRKLQRISNKVGNSRVCPSDDERLAESLQFDDSDSGIDNDGDGNEDVESDKDGDGDRGNDTDDRNESNDDSDAIKRPHWKSMDLEVGDLVVLNGGKGDKWWVARVLQLLDVVWDSDLAQQQPSLYEGDVLVLQFTGKGVNGTFKPPKKGQLPTKVWAESADQWGDADKILDVTGKLQADIRRKVGK